MCVGRRDIGQVELSASSAGKFPFSEQIDILDPFCHELARADVLHEKREGRILVADSGRTSCKYSPLAECHRPESDLRLLRGQACAS